jgi:hypothetical protein
VPASAARQHTGGLARPCTRARPRLAELPQPLALPLMRRLLAARSRFTNRGGGLLNVTADPAAPRGVRVNGFPVALANQATADGAAVLNLLDGVLLAPPEASVVLQRRAQAAAGAAGAGGAAGTGGAEESGPKAADGGGHGGGAARAHHGIDERRGRRHRQRRGRRARRAGCGGRLPLRPCSCSRVALSEGDRRGVQTLLGASNLYRTDGSLGLGLPRERPPPLPRAPRATHGCTARAVPLVNALAPGINRSSRKRTGRGRQRWCEWRSSACSSRRRTQRRSQQCRSNAAVAARDSTAAGCPGLLRAIAANSTRNRLPAILQGL